MTGEMISDLLKPLIGQSGTIFLVMTQTGQFGFTTAENKKLTGVAIRPDGLVRIERENGWAVLDPVRGRGRGLEQRHGPLTGPVPVGGRRPRRADTGCG